MAFSLKIGSVQNEAVHDALAETEPPKLDGNSRDRGVESGVENKHNIIQAQDLPRAPIGDPLTASLLKTSLSKDAKLDGEISEIGQQKEEAGQKYANAMDAAAAQLAESVLGGVAANLGTNATSSDNNSGSSNGKREDDSRSGIRKNW